MKKLILFLTLSVLSFNLMANEYMEEPYDQGYEQHEDEPRRPDPKPVLDRSPDSEDRPYEEDVPQQQDQYQQQDPHQQQDPYQDAPQFQEPIEEVPEIYN